MNERREELVFARCDRRGSVSAFCALKAQVLVDACIDAVQADGLSITEDTLENEAKRWEVMDKEEAVEAFG